MRSFVVAVVVVLAVVSGCGNDDDGSSGGEVDVDSDSDIAQAYLADLEEAGLGDLYADDETAVAFVATACTNADQIGRTPEELIASDATSPQAAVALEYCDTDLRG